MGEVYRARDTKLGRDVAIKVLPDAFAQDRERLARFDREAKTLAALNHPGIAQIYGIEGADGSQALVMELVEGPTLADRIAEGPIPVDEALAIARQIAVALEAAHEQGIIHRDLKPANVKLRPDGTVKVLDFGLAKAMDPAGAMSPGLSQSPTITTPAMTRAGLILGTAAYMSPEQAKGRAADRRSDVWAFGVVLFEMLTGRRAFEAEDVSETLAAVLTRELNWNDLPDALSPAMRRVLRLCLEKDPRQRLQAIGDVRLALEGAFEARDERRAAAERPTLGWRHALVALVALIVTSAATGAAVWVLTRPAPRPTSRFVIATSRTEPLSSGTGTDFAISPDGTEVVYVADRNGENHLVRRRIDQLEGQPIPGTEGAQMPFFSPDGESVAFGAFPEGILKKVSLSGGPPLPITDVPDLRNASWGGDDTIVFASGLADGGLFVVSANGGTPKLVASPDASRDEAWYRWPEVLPGGRAILYTTAPTGAIDQAKVAVLSLDTGERRELVTGSNPHYTASGHLVYGLVGSLMAIPFDLDRLDVRGSPVRVLEGITTKGGGAANFAVSREGSLIYLPGGAEIGAPFQGTPTWVDREGQALSPIADELLQRPRNLRLSPDGRRLALVTGPLASGGVWIYDLEGRPPTPLTLEGDNRNPVWAADGTRVAFQSDRTGYTLFWMPANGSTMALEPLGSPSPNLKYSAAWSPENEELIYWESRPAEKTGDDILAQPLGTEPREVLATEFNEFLPSLSRDGRWLAYVSDVTGQDEIWVRAYPDGSSPVRVSSNGGTEPVWSHDGEELFYLETNRMMSVPVEAGTTFRFQPAVELFDEPYAHPPSPPTFDVAPDGRFMMIQPATGGDLEGPPGIVFVLNWFEELSSRVPTD